MTLTQHPSPLYYALLCLCLCAASANIIYYSILEYSVLFYPLDRGMISCTAQLRITSLSSLSYPILSYPILSATKNRVALILRANRFIKHVPSYPIESYPILSGAPAGRWTRRSAHRFPRQDAHSRIKPLLSTQKVKGGKGREGEGRGVK
jgi:hypothetical protein